MLHRRQAGLPRLYRSARRPLSDFVGPCQAKPFHLSTAPERRLNSPLTNFAIDYSSIKSFFTLREAHTCTVARRTQQKKKGIPTQMKLVSHTRNEGRRGGVGCAGYWIKEWLGTAWKSLASLGRLYRTCKRLGYPCDWLGYPACLASSNLFSAIGGEWVYILHQCNRDTNSTKHMARQNFSKPELTPLKGDWWLTLGALTSVEVARLGGDLPVSSRNSRRAMPGFTSCAMPGLDTPRTLRLGAQPCSWTCL